MKFDSVLGAIQLPGGLYLGEVAGVATNSKGDIFVYTRTGHPTVTIGTMLALPARRIVKSARPASAGIERLFAL